MRATVNALLLLLAWATDRALARHVQFLKVENCVLRSKLPRVVKLTPQERCRLVKFGRPLGPAIKELITVVSPRTFLRWLDADGRERTRRAGPTRPRLPRAGVCPTRAAAPAPPQDNNHSADTGDAAPTARLASTLRFAPEGVSR